MALQRYDCSWRVSRSCALGFLFGGTSSAHDMKVLSLMDNIVTAGCMGKGSSPAPSLKYLCGQRTAACMAARLSWVLPWTETSLMPADEISQHGFRLRRPDLHQLAKIQVSSLDRYCKCIRPLGAWFVEHRYVPKGPDQWMMCCWIGRMSLSHREHSLKPQMRPPNSFFRASMCAWR